MILTVSLNHPQNRHLYGVFFEKNIETLKVKNILSNKLKQKGTAALI